ncbi:DUF3592 domain-containing protein [Micavibrio aeruginosavorus]|uniref:DUF3592 domain-containing protein n=1 Tax=Micavibrio aeruginosavorus TaxID=349221 RepID=UPI003F4AB98A
MNGMIGLMAAVQQVGWLVAGLFFWFIAFVMILSHIHDRRTKTTYAGNIAALRVRGDMAKGKAVYYPIVSYTNDAGEVVEAETRHGSSGLAGKLPGRPVRVMPDAHDPRVATIRDGSGVFLALVLWMIGALPIAIGVSQHPVTPYTITVFVAFGAWAVWRVTRMIRPRHEWQSRDEFRRRKAGELLAKRAQCARINRDEAMAQLKATDDLAFRFVPLSLFVALIFIGVAGWVGYDTGALLRNRAYAEGRIVALDRPTGSDSYYPVVEYRTHDDVQVRFTDKAGSNAPGVSIGQRVDVIYDARAPEHAMMGAGFSAAWIVVLASGLVGLAVLAAAVRTFFGVLGRRRGGHEIT